LKIFKHLAALRNGGVAKFPLSKFFKKIGTFKEISGYSLVNLHFREISLEIYGNLLATLILGMF